MERVKKSILLEIRLREKALRYRKHKNQVLCLSTLCFGLMILVIGLEGFSSSLPGNGGKIASYCGSSIFTVNAGGYVIAAIAAFMAGVLVTVICIKYRQSAKDKENKGQEEKRKEN